MKPKLLRISTVPMSLNVLLKGQLKFLNQYFEVTAVSGAGKDLDEVKEREQVKIQAVEMQRNISPVKDFISLIKLYLLFRKEKPEIVHSITPKAGLLSMIAGKMAGVPIRMHTFTGLIFPSKTGLMQKLLIAMDRLLCRAATHIYPEGNGVKNDLINYKITSKPLKVLANGNVNGIDLEYFNPNQIPESQKQNLKNQLGIKKDDFVFIFVGRLVGDKGLNELVTTFSSLTPQLPNPSTPQLPNSPTPQLPNSSTLKLPNSSTPQLLLVGSLESELDPLQPQTLKEIEANPNIISVGFQSDVRPYFAVSDCLVFPSYREGFPNVVMQAGAMGLPSIVSDINGCNEIIVEDENGTIIPVKNSEAISEAMQKMMSNKLYYEQLKAKARPMIENRYEQKIVWEAILEEYRSILK
ncbi:MAG: glycosyltransferase family 4 protein [Bergeyella sp.]